MNIPIIDDMFSPCKHGSVVEYVLDCVDQNKQPLFFGAIPYDGLKGNGLLVSRDVRIFFDASGKSDSFISTQEFIITADNRFVPVVGRNYAAQSSGRVSGQLPKYVLSNNVWSVSNLSNRAMFYHRHFQSKKR